MIFKPLLHGGLVVAALALVLIAGATDSVADTTFDPQVGVTIEDPTPETASAFTTELSIGATDVNFAALVSFIPPEWGVVPGDQMPIGTDVGSLDSATTTLGLFNNACAENLRVHFDFKNASIDITDTVSFLDTDKTDSDNTADYAKDVDGNGLYDAIDKYPEFLNRLFDVDNLQPIRRSAGITLVAGIPVLLQFLIFPPGTVISDVLPADEERGFPSVTVLQNAGDPEASPQPSAITDFCTPLGTVNNTLGVTCDPAAAPDPESLAICDEGYAEPGQPLFVNPKAGTYSFSVVSFGQRDADGDGFENSLDTCALIPNTGTPKVKYDGDLDGDGLDAACDPNDDPATQGTNSDQDLDGYQNRQDNCPLDPNGQEEDNQKDTDRDQIGDACDPDSEVENGDLTPSDLASEVVIGGGGEGGPPACAAEGGADGVQCWYEGYEPDVEPGPTDGGSDEPTPTGDEPTDGATDTPDDEDDDGGSGSTVLIVVAAIAAIAILGGGAAMLLRRREGGS